MTGAEIFAFVLYITGLITIWIVGLYQSLTMPVTANTDLNKTHGVLVGFGGLFWPIVALVVFLMKLHDLYEFQCGRKTQ